MKKSADLENEFPHAKKTERLADVIPRFMSSMKKDMEKTYQYHLMTAHWGDIVGDVVASHVKPVRMDFRKLFLAVDAPVWSNELRYMERQIIDKINSFVCSELITSIAFCASDSDIVYKRNQGEKDVSDRERIVPLREEKEISKAAVSKIEDEDLRRVAANAYAQNLALRRVRLQEKWHPCAVCGRIVPPEQEICSSCAREKREKEISAVYRLFLKEPWLRVREAAGIAGCSHDIAREARSLLLQKMISRVRADKSDGKNAEMLVMLFASVKPEDLTETIKKKYMKRLRFDLQSEEHAEKRTFKKISGVRKKGE